MNLASIYLYIPDTNLPHKDAESMTSRKPRYVPDMSHPGKCEAFVNYEIDQLEYVYSFDETCYTITSFI